MTIRRRRRLLAALVAVTALTIAACGTRLDHATIAGSTGGPAGQGQQVPGDEGTFDGPEDEGFDDDASDELGDTDSAGDDTGGPGGTAGADATSPANRAQAGGSSEQGKQRGGGGGDGPIVIGTVGTYSGPPGTAWAQGARALQAWAASVNEQGGINGRKVQAIVMDDGGDPARSRSQVQELVEQRNAVAIVAAMTSGAALPSWKGYVEEKKIPVVGGDCGPNWDGSPVLFRQCTASKDNVYGLAVLGAKHGKGTKFGGLFCQEADDCSFAQDRLFRQGDAKRAGLDPVYQARISITQPDFTSECIQARNAGVELMMVAGDPNTVARVAASCRRQNFSPQFLQPDATVDAGSPGKPGLGDLIMGMRTFPFTGTSSNAAKEFRAAWNKHGGGQEPGAAASMGWAAAKVFEHAAKDAGEKVTREELLKRLYRVNDNRFGGLTVPLTFTDKGSTAPKCLFLMQGRGGEWTAPGGDKPECF